jgi:hypothetical protein
MAPVDQAGPSASQSQSSSGGELQRQVDKLKRQVEDKEAKIQGLTTERDTYKTRSKENYDLYRKEQQDLGTEQSKLAEREIERRKMILQIGRYRSLRNAFVSRRDAQNDRVTVDGSVGVVQNAFRNPDINERAIMYELEYPGLMFFATYEARDWSSI